MSHPIIGAEQTGDDRAAARLRPPLKDYWRTLIAPALANIADDGDLAVFLNFQLEQLEVDAERPDGDPAAADKASVVGAVLDIVKLRIRARIAAAERAVAHIRTAKEAA